MIEKSIATFGFPIVMCAVLIWYMYKKELMHKQEIDLLRTSLDNNTQILTRLYERMSNE